MPLAENRELIMKVKLLMCLLIGFMFYISVASISVNALWWNSSWDYKKEIPIDATGLSIQDNYQLLINVSHVTDKMNSTFKDLRFTNGSENTLLSYWIEYNASSNYAETWVKIPAISNTTNTSIYMYYGNDAVATARDGDGTFIFFDNASGTIGDKWNTSEGDNTAAFSYASGYIQADWDTGGQMTRIKIADGPTVPNDMIMDYKQWVSGTQGLPGVMPRYISKDNNYDIWVPSADINLARMFKTVSGSRTEVSTTSGKSVSENVWHDMSVSAVGTTFKIYANEVLQHTATDANHATGKVGLFAYYDDPAVQRWDDVRVREYSANEANINYSFGAEQTSNVAPTIIANATSPSPLNADNDWLINGTVTDPEELTTMFYVLFHKNGAALGGVYEYNITNNTNSIVATLTEGNFTYGDNMTAEFWGGDGTVNTSKTNMTATVTNTLVCEEITSAGTYTMNHNLSSSGTCVTIAVDNVIVDGAGYTINYSQSAAGYGINLNAFTNGDNASIKNVNIVQGSAQSYSWGIRMAYSDNSNITNNTVITHGLESHPIYAYIATSNIILDNTLTTDGTASRGIFVYRGSHNNISGGSINSDKSYDYYIQDCGSTHNFTNTGFTEERDIYIYDAVSWFNYNNETGGNLWLKNKVSAQGYLNRTLTTWTQADMTWNDSASVALTASYNITGLTASTNHNVTNSTGGSSTTQIIATDATGKITFDIAMAQDANTELKVEEIAYVACGTLNSANTVYTLTQNISSTGTCFTIGAHNITLDGGGYTINFSTTSAGSGILNTAGYDNLTIKNTKISQYSTSSSSYGIQFNGVINSNITSNSIDIKGASSTGIFFWGENDNTVENNNITTTGSSSNGMYLTDSHDNNITNNEITISGASSDGVELTSGSTSNIFLNNTIYSNAASSIAFKLERGSYLTSITGGSIASEKGYDYYLRAITCGISEPCGPSNNFTDTNFTAMRKLYFYDTTHVFNYNNETNGDIWLKTKSSTAAKELNRTLFNWTNSSMLWNDTVSGSLEVSYTLTGLLASTYYNVKNTTSSGSTTTTKQTDSNGDISQFEITLNGNTQMEIKPSPPSFSDNSTNSTFAGSQISHHLKITAGFGLSGYIFSFDNGTGTLSNDSWVPLTGIINWSNVTKSVNDTVGTTIQWKVYANDTEANWADSDTYSYITTTDCSPPTSGNWTLNMSLNCNISGETIHLGADGWLKLIENGSASFIDTILSAVGIEWESDIEARLNMSGTNVTFNWTG